MTIDTAINTAMLSIENPVLTTISNVLSIIFDPIVLVILTLIISAILYKKLQKQEATIFTLAVLLTSVIVIVLKSIIQRARPLNMIIHEPGFALPSGHATLTTIFLGFAAYLIIKKSPDTKIAMTATAILATLIVAFSRIYLRAHWLTDILAGIAIGAIILTIAIKVHKKMSGPHTPRVNDPIISAKAR
jgi:membrane-associated phospholipid phosphatase